MRELAVTAIGRDRPGIVAAISEALLDMQGNIEDSQMSILGGHFAVMLIVGVPDTVDATELEGRLEAVRRELGLEAIAVNSVDAVDAARPHPSHVITVYGADHPGIASQGVNITGLETRIAGAEDAPIYAMILEVALGEAAESDVEGALRAVGEEAKVEVSVRPLEAETL